MIRKRTASGFALPWLAAMDEVPEDTTDYFVVGGLKALVEASTREFYTGNDFKCHPFGPGGFKFGFGHELCTPLDSVAGYTEINLERRDVIGDFMNNFIGDATLALGKTRVIRQCLTA